MKTPADRPLMIVDDDDDLRNAMEYIMTAQGYDVEAYGDAREALVALRRERRPFLILLDLMMAGMSGWEFRTAQLEDPKLAPIPVVVLTAVSSLNDGTHMLSGVEIMEKPFDLDSLLITVGRHAAAADGADAGPGGSGGS